MFNCCIEDGVMDVLAELGLGAVVFSPLAQGGTNKYLNDIPEDSRVWRSGVFLKQSDLTEEELNKVRAIELAGLTAWAEHGPICYLMDIATVGDYNRVN